MSFYILPMLVLWCAVGLSWYNKAKPAKSTYRRLDGQLYLGLTSPGKWFIISLIPVLNWGYMTVFAADGITRLLLDLNSTPIKNMFNKAENYLNTRIFK